MLVVAIVVVGSVNIRNIFFLKQDDVKEKGHINLEIKAN